MKKKIAVVTGGAGFIGSHLVDLLLKKNFIVRVIDNLVGGRIDNIKQHKHKWSPQQTCSRYYEY